MPKSRNEIVAFNVGELDAKALARVDLETYERGAAIMENCWPLVQGGLAKMPGTQYLVTTRSGNDARLRPFVFNESISFALELSPEVTQGQGGVLRLLDQSGAQVTAVNTGTSLGSLVDSSFTETGTAAAEPSPDVTPPDIEIDFDWDDLRYDIGRGFGEF